MPDKKPLENFGKYDNKGIFFEETGKGGLWEAISQPTAQSIASSAERVAKQAANYRFSSLDFIGDLMHESPKYSRIALPQRLQDLFIAIKYQGKQAKELAKQAHKSGSEAIRARAAEELEIYRANIEAFNQEIESIPEAGRHLIYFICLAAEERPEATGRTPAEILSGINEAGEPAGEFAELIQSAIRARAELFKAWKNPQKPDNIIIPLDKMNSIERGAYSIALQEYGERIPYNIEANRRTPLYLLLEPIEGAILSAPLQPYDKRVLAAIDALYQANQREKIKIFTLKKIHETITGKRPSAADLDKLHASIKKMLKIYCNAEYHGNWKRAGANLNISGAILQGYLEKITLDNGKSAEAFQVNARPILHELSTRLKQFTAVAPALLQSPGSFTENKIILQDFLIEKIARAKNQKLKAIEIDLSPLFNRLEIDASHKSRIKKQICQELEYYKNQGYIKSYKIAENALKINL